ncbi:Transposase, Mutator family [Clostridium sp. C105KSO13]|nr:Transposase, Mutator family [Clostridium sp. C105KSO13]
MNTEVRWDKTLKIKTGRDDSNGVMRNDRMFPCTKRYFEHEIIRGSEQSGVKRIRIHDLRHSHAKKWLKNTLSYHQNKEMNMHSFFLKIWICFISDVYELFRESFKDMLQELLEAEMDVSIGYPKNAKDDIITTNKRNGYSPKMVKSQYGEIPIKIPRDRNGEFEPQIVQKHQRDVSGIEEKIISLYARSMSTRDIHDQIEDLYGIQLSADMVSKITDKILPNVKE